MSKIEKINLDGTMLELASNKWQLLVDHTLVANTYFINFPIDDTNLSELYVEINVKPITDTIVKNSVRCGINATAWYQVSHKPLFIANNCLHASWEAIITSHIFRIGGSWRNGYSHLNGPGSLRADTSPQINYASSHIASETPKIENIAFDNDNGSQLPAGSIIKIYGR